MPNAVRNRIIVSCLKARIDDQATNRQCNAWKYRTSPVFATWITAAFHDALCQLLFCTHINEPLVDVMLQL